MTTSDEPVKVDVGTFRSVSQFHYMVATQLSQLRAAVRARPQRHVIWDLSGVDFDGRLSTAALTCFLAFAFEVRQSVQRTPSAEVKWNPRLQSFWKAMGLFEIVQRLDILNWPEGMIGGFPPSTLKPSSRITVFHRPSTTPEYGDTDWGTFKDTQRELLFADISISLEDTLEQWERRLGTPGRLKRRLIEVLAELILNSWTWGEASAFVGIQQTGNRLTAAIVDTGRGFLHSVTARKRANHEQFPLPSVETELHAVMLGCILNHEIYALRGALHFVLTNGGWAIVASNADELHLERPLWEAVVSKIPSPVDRTTLSIDSLCDAFGQAADAVAITTPDQRQIGYYRRWHEKLVGSRIVFELHANSSSSCK
jgi:hypothetical protein